VVLEELLCSSKPGGILCTMQNVTATTMVACWYI
jgi:hypothetical protein